MSLFFAAHSSLAAPRRAAGQVYPTSAAGRRATAAASRELTPPVAIPFLREMGVTAVLR